MPYNPEIDANVVIGKEYHAMLKEIVTAKGQTIKRGLELLIVEAHRATERSTAKWAK